MKNRQIYNKNNCRGVTLIALTVAVVILVIISSILIYNAKNGIKMRNIKMMQNDIEILNDQINAYYIKYGAIPASQQYMEDVSRFKQLNDNDIYYIIDLSALEGLTLNYGANEEKDDVYIINEQSHHIYYAKGLEIDGVWYYTNDIDENVELKQKNN